MQFNQTSTKDGLVQDVDFLVNTDRNKYPLLDIARNVNEWFHKVVTTIIKAQDQWKWDDSNNTDLPVATANLVADQTDYSEPTGLKITRVEAKDASSGNFVLLKKIDEEDINVALDEFRNTSGIPEFYRVEANSIFLYPAPSYASSGGLKVYFQRGASTFSGDNSSGDNSKEPGFEKEFHRILSLGAAFDYASAKGLKNKNELFQRAMAKLEDLKEFYANKSSDKRKSLNIYKSGRDFE